jgi:uncharacterized Zn finger protein
VSLGREFLRQGLRQVGESHDEGETSTAFAECLPIVFEAVTRSSLSMPKRLLFAIDAELDDNYEAIGAATEALFDAPATPEDWSVVADTLANRLQTALGLDKRGGDDFSRDYRRARVTSWIAQALEEAGRDEELWRLYESEARSTGSYERLVRFLLEQKHFEDAERWAKEGIAATSAKLPGIAANLAKRLCEIAQHRKQWDVVAAHAAREFFSDSAGPFTFDELIKAARTAQVEEPVRAAALRFLETGVMPYQVISPSPAAAPVTGTRPSVKGRAASILPSAPAEPVCVKIDLSWPLPVPDYLVPLLNRPGRHDQAPRPHLDVLLQMAIAAKRPDEVLRWFDKMLGEPNRAGSHSSALGDADRVAEAVSPAYPERALEIYLAALNARLLHAEYSAYEAASDYLRRLRPIYEALGRSSDWTALLTSIREKYRNRPRFMELLDKVAGRTIVPSTRPRPR